MLQSLHVKNLALIDEAEVEFTPGLNILTGETGAGKSIIIGSINLALGERVPKEMLKDNDSPAYVELIFTVEDEQTLAKLNNTDIDCEEGFVILSRKIANGKSVARVNGMAVSASRLREVSSLLIDIHGQHEHQSLLSRKNHLEILDAYAKKELGDKKQVMAGLYKEYRKLQEEYDNASMDAESRNREIAVLEYEVEEITEASLVRGEDEQLEEQYKKYVNGRKIMDAAEMAYQACAGHGENASDLISRGLRELTSVASYDKELDNLLSQLYDLESLMHDFSHELGAYISNNNFDEEMFYQIEKRLNIINHLKSKYGRSIDIILNSCQEKEERIAVLRDYDAYLEGLRKRLHDTENKLKAVSQEVSLIRQTKARVLCAEVVEALKDLNFLNVVFDMEFHGLDHYTANGMDDPEFMISTNPGETLKPLGKVASGGELSRIMLGIKTIMAQADAIETLIFDEIDSGISGRTAQMVAEKMNELGRHRQIICITHLPQIAAMADNHFLIEKKVVNNTTTSNIRTMDKEESVMELARMLGGVEITEAVIQNAKEMQELAYMKK